MREVILHVGCQITSSFRFGYGLGLDAIKIKVQDLKCYFQISGLICKIK